MFAGGGGDKGRELQPDYRVRPASATSLPAYTRAAFAKKAAWFRLLARIGEKKEPAALAKPKHPFGFIAAMH